MLYDDCPICRDDFDLRIQHEMHKRLKKTGKKGGRVVMDEEMVDPDAGSIRDELFEKQW
jgi:hypothetical protein